MVDRPCYLSRTDGDAGTIVRQIVASRCQMLNEVSCTFRTDGDEATSRQDHRILIDPCYHPTYNVCHPIALPGKAHYLKLAIRVSLLVVWLAAASAVFADELIVTALITATTALIVPTFVVEWRRGRVALIAERGRPADVRIGSEISQ